MQFSQVPGVCRKETQIPKDDILFLDVRNPLIRLYGVFYENGKYRRIPEAVAGAVSENVTILHTNTAGGRIRFRTDSSYIGICAKSDGLGQMGHFALSGSAGFDLYRVVDGEEVYECTYVPPFDMTDGYEHWLELNTREMREFVLNFPLYSNVTSLELGLEADCQLVEPETEYLPIPPVVYYGSSITQGACANRPGTCYEAILSRRFHCDHINLGFSGSALAEDAIIEYMCGLPMSVFVEDYDHNAPTPEHLEKTHHKLYQAIRKSHPDIPILMMNRPKFFMVADEGRRREIVRESYEQALAEGDRNVYLLTNVDLTRLCGNEGTADNCHPTDLGFASMAAAVGDLFEKIGCLKP